MKKTKHAFTLAEALILLLIAALLAAALVPVITRKHKEVGEHGEWVCTMNSEGKHVVKSTFRGKVTQFEVAANNGDMCVFSPPAAAKDFTVKAVGGGGSGAGGTQGGVETVYDSRGDNSNYAGVIETDGNYNIMYAGGGGGGGGMACGEAKDQSGTINTDFNSIKLFCDEILDQDGTATGAYGDPGRCVETTKYDNGDRTDDWVFHPSDSFSDPPKYIPISEHPTPPNNAGGYCKRIDEAGNIECNANGGKGFHGPDFIPGTSEYQYHEFGYFDVPIDGFDYNLLKLNDREYSSNSQYNAKTDPIPKVTIYDVDGKEIKDVPVFDVKYYYLADTSDEYQAAGSTPPYDPSNGTFNTYQQKVMCFAESGVPMSKEMKGGSYKGLYLNNLDDPENDPGIKCWNLPGMGGSQGAVINLAEIEGLRAGQSIFVSEGTNGTGQQTGGQHTVGAFLLDSSGQLSLQTAQSYDGGPGSDGTETVLTIGNEQYTAAGGKGGAARQLKSMQDQYVNIPVREASVKPRTISSYADNPWCEDHTGVEASECAKHPACSAECNPNWCEWPVCYEEDPETGACIKPGTDSGYSEYHCGCKDYDCVSPRHARVYYDSYEVQPTIIIRKKYFNTINVNTCIYSADIGDPTQLPMMAHDGDTNFILNSKQVTMKGTNFVPDADFPKFNGSPTLYEVDNSDGNDLYYYTLDAADRKRYEGEPGSGGYGAGELTKNYVKVDDTGKSFAKFTGDDGVKGYAAILKSSAYGGTGGQAGQYVSTMVKKLGKLEITVGRPGAPGSPDYDGIAGGDTIIKQYGEEKPMFLLKGGSAGQAKKLNVMSTSTDVKGGNGAASPIENESNRARILPLGGLSSDDAGNTNSSMDGQTAAIGEIWGGDEPVTGACFGLPATVSAVLNMIGGHPLDMTYGAGGGGGAGGKDGAGFGGAGTPGAVIIKW